MRSTARQKGHVVCTNQKLYGLLVAWNDPGHLLPVPYGSKNVAIAFDKKPLQHDGRATKSLPEHFELDFPRPAFLMFV